MSNLTIVADKSSNIEVTVRESDRYTESVYVKFTRSCFNAESRGCDEMFLTPTELDLLGRFMIRQASEIRYAQGSRDTDLM